MSGPPRLPVYVWGPGARHPRWQEVAAAQPDLDVAPAATLGAALAAWHGAGGDAPAAVVDGGVTVGRDLAGDVRRAVDDPRLAGLPWLLLAAGGVTFAGRYRSNATYPDGPAVAAGYDPRALVAADPGLVVLRGAASWRAPPGGLDGLVAAGWERRLAAYVSPYLRYARDTEPEERDVAADAARRLDPGEARRRLDGVRPPPPVGVVVRTTLGRPHLLRRCVASLAAAARAGGPPESVVLVGEPPRDELAAAAAELGKTSGLAIEPHSVGGAGVPGRTAALTAGIERSGGDYVWFVDDDDAAESGALVAIGNAVHTRDRPLVVGPSVAYEELWTGAGAAARLEHAAELRGYDAAQWPRVFTGWNFLPICSVAYPREVARRRLEATPLRHDLGEDYALLLLVLGTPGLSVVEVPETLARVSIRRDGTNVVTNSDRTEWVRDGASFTGDVAADPYAGSPVLWALGEALRHSVPLERHRDLVAAARGPGWKALARRIVPPRLRPALRRLLRRPVGGRQP